MGLKQMQRTPVLEKNDGTHGFVAEGFEIVAELFRANFSARQEVGAAFSAVVDGRMVVDLWGGTRDRVTADPWKQDTMQLTFSGTKGIVAGVLLMLVDRGLLGLDEPVATYWPEFAQHGKGDITVGNVLSHRAGLPIIEGPVFEDDLIDPEAMAARLAGQEPRWPHASRASYHALTYGWLCGEIVRRVTGASIGEFVRTEIAEPLGVDLWLGLPPELEERVSQLCLGEDFTAVKEYICSGDGGPRYANPGLFDEPLIWNQPRFHQAEIPGVNAIIDARSMATYYGCLALGGTLGDVRLTSPETIAQFVTERTRAVDALSGESLAFGAGFMLQSQNAEFGPALAAYGHTGAGGSIHGMWPRHRTGFSYITNQMCDDTDDDRTRGLLAALYAAVCRG
ncbi:serine hydrolase domain-containing protein [Microbacterium sp. LMC-P-041]|uniref:serine hydrolase domain-containing protein n=1 Tax=Microbacterium sp. LMC-P-041 TaxID=3040293 RepID=UPI00255549A2|nr:serine hydrolase domain-containing protein [Microbacterium sp. LMC-P-041]